MREGVGRKEILAHKSYGLFLAHKSYGLFLAHKSYGLFLAHKSYGVILVRFGHSNNISILSNNVASFLPGVKAASIRQFYALYIGAPRPAVRLAFFFHPGAFSC
jgi:hypothetical protein